MAAQATAAACVRQSTSVATPDPARSTCVDGALALLRAAVHETGWTLDALGAAMGMDKSLISRMLNGERPVTLRFLTALPDDVEAVFLQKRAEAFGLIVVAPAADGEQAIRDFTRGLFGLLAPKLRMAKAGL